ncbi:MAG: response regulator transcription factor [Clostridium sp.]|jgi:DNA-binding response OmpR family regulator|uniref:response regulator transcription factor n=1 Tax=Clostridium sp. TaxID=1506 RepID=UPI0025BBC04C|nr:response regulator transcription factor [Clostridium sp.]MCH3963566.1 response regulator transcription factor [Clostridium sp.]MCI1714707.1 response regulator transcription factor [Clostridium sp.]MCI1799104.1 response regulator transcription factor [Clostridium sp.]MCI1812890.1 response regulator transcription factor [Clostridium sp.]MCI1869780.1 response regulator transcription factor [Clostridium sp.]
MNNILIIEDELKVSEIIKAYLEREGYNVFCAAGGYDGLSLFNKKDFQLVILDLMLPDIDGEDVCRIMRETSKVHIFMLTAKVELSDKIQGLNIGADEYLTKPLSPRELTARVNALFRRINSDKSEIFSYDNGKFKIDRERRRVEVNGKDIVLTPNEFDILYALASNKGKVLSREQLIQNVYGIDFDGSDRTVDAHIKNLRKKIENSSKTPKYIITVVKLGYRFGVERDY